jgi:hypothetical protein
MNSLTDDEIRARLDAAANTMPLSTPEWNGPTVSLTERAPVRQPRRWIAVGVGVAAAAALIGVSAVAINGRSSDNRTVASQPVVETGSGGAASPPAATSGGGVASASQVQCGSQPFTVGSGVSATESRDVPSGVTGVVVRGCADLEVTQGAASASVTADDNLLAQITTAVEGSLFVIDVSGGFSSTAVPTVNVSLPTVTDLTVDGASDVTATGIDGESLNVSVDGAGDVSVDGGVTSVSISVSGAGDVDTSGLTASSASVTLSGAGDVTVAGASVSVEISGAGDVTVVTAGASITASVSGAGEVFDADGNVVGAGPDVSIPDVSIPDVSIPDVSIPDVSIPDVSIPDVSLPDVSIPDVSIPDVSLPDISIPDVSIPDLSGYERDLDEQLADLDAQLAELEAQLDAQFGG